MTNTTKSSEKISKLDLKTINENSQAAWDRGERLLCTHHLGVDDREHVALLATFYQPMGYVLDAGCGFGEVSRLMQVLKVPALFMHLNISTAQLAHCPNPWRLGDAERMPFQDETFDGVMFNSALCNMDRGKALMEAYRVLRPGGWLYISDVVVDKDLLDPEFETDFHCHVTTALEFVEAVIAVGFSPQNFAFPKGLLRHMQDAERFMVLEPFLLKAVK